jgi:hypothetical protein
MALAGLTLPGQRVLNYGNPVNPNAPLNRGLVGWWLNLPSRGKGNTFFDLCGKYHGTLTNGPTWSGARRSGGFGSIECLDASDRVDVSDTSALMVGTQDFTFSIDFCRNGAQSPTNAVFAGKGDGSVNTEWALTLRGSDDRLAWMNGANISDAGFGGVGGTTDKRWHTATISRIGDVFTLYLDTVQVDQDTFAGLNINKAISFALGDAEATASGFVGWLDNARYWIGRGLSAGEVAANIQASRLGYPNELNWVRRQYVFEAGGGGGGDPEGSLIGGKLIRGGLLLHGVLGR